MVVGGAYDEEGAFGVSIADAEFQVERAAAPATSERPSGYRLITRNDRGESEAFAGRDSRL
jgi:hypothetical protein